MSRSGSTGGRGGASGMATATPVSQKPQWPQRFLSPGRSMSKCNASAYAKHRSPVTSLMTWLARWNASVSSCFKPAKISSARVVISAGVRGSFFDMTRYRFLSPETFNLIKLERRARL